MSAIVAVHGIGQQFKGGAIIHREWWAALRSGLQLAGRDLTDEQALACPFYGHLFRRPGTLAVADTEVDPADVTAQEVELLEQWWQEAARLEPDRVKGPDYYAPQASLARAPMLVQRALSALTRSSFFADIYQSVIIGDLRQVTLYLNEPKIHNQALELVSNAITAETRVVIGHSLGSVVAYEALCRDSRNVVSFVTLGSPLGIPNVIFDRLTPNPGMFGLGVWPGKIAHWTNLADKGDIVALEKQLARRFGPQVRDIPIYSGADAHHGERYLTARETGEAISAGLWGKDC
jgi:hypothetical protein